MSSQAYTPGLKRKDLTLIRKERRLPVQGKVLVKVGAAVSHDTTIAVTEVPGDPNLINLALELDTLPEDIEGCLLKKKGDAVKKDELIAFKQSFFGLLKKEVRSPTDGTLAFFSSVTGQAVVESPPVRVELKAYVPGHVAEVMPSEGAIIETYGAFIQGIFGIGGETHGELAMAVENPEDTLTPEQISAEHSGKVLVGGALVTGAAVKKAIEMGDGEVAHIGLARIAHSENRPGYASDLTHKALAFNPVHARSYLMLAMLLGGEGRLPEAGQALQRFIDLNQFSSGDTPSA